MTDINAITAIHSNSNAVGIACYDATAPSDNVGTMSFGDFLDMVNPLQHIPLVSSVYRAATGESINPVSRIAGDALYGGIMGLASAGIAALGAAADEGFAALNGGKDMSQTIVAALTGDESDASVQTASTAAPDTTTATDALSAAPVLESASPDTQAQATQVALLQTPARQSPILDMPDFSAAATTAQAPTSVATAPISTATLTDATTTSAPTGMAIDRSKQPYGGVMDSAMMQNAMQNQTLALALAGGQQALQSQHSIRNNRFSSTTASPVTATTAQSAALPLPGNTPMLSGGPSSAANQTSGLNALATATPATASPTNAADTTPSTIAAAMPSALRSIPQTGSNDLKLIKGLDNYRTTAQRVPVPYVGTTVNVTN